MEIKRQFIEGSKCQVPCITLTPHVSKGSAVIIHGYGGSKEEQLGLGLRAAEAGMTTYVIDLRGHGDHGLPMDENIGQDVEAAVNHAKTSGKVVTIGHSLGGRLALLSNSDYTIAISPALTKTFSNQTQETLKALRSYRVREINPDINFEALGSLPEWQSTDTKKIQIVFGSRDVPEIKAACFQLKERGIPAAQIDNALHSDIFLLEETFKIIDNKLKEWF